MVIVTNLLYLNIFIFKNNLSIETNGYDILVYLNFLVFLNI